MNSEEAAKQIAVPFVDSVKRGSIGFSVCTGTTFEKPREKGLTFFYPRCTILFADTDD